MIDGAAVEVGEAGAQRAVFDVALFGASALVVLEQLVAALGGQPLDGLQWQRGELRETHVGELGAGATIAGRRVRARPRTPGARP